MVAGGLILSSVAPSIYFLFFSYGILVGLGCGLVYTATVTVTCQYFDRRRGLALGLISTGSSLGLFVYAALQRELIDLYKVEGCLQIVGAVSLNIVAFGILMRPLKSFDTTLAETHCMERITDQSLIYHEKGPENKEMISILEKTSIMENSANFVCNGHCKNEEISVKDMLLSMLSKETNLHQTKAGKKCVCKQIAKSKWHMIVNYWKDTMVLFKNKVFSALFVAIFLFDLGGFPPTLLLEDIAKSAGINEETYVVPLVSIMGISAVIGKFVLGLLADFAFINSIYLYVSTLLGTGLALLVVPFANSYITLAILAGILGFLSGNWSIFPYVTTKTVGLEKLTHSYGILMFFAGTGNCLGPPIIGWFYDWTQTYSIAFYFSGICVLLGGFLLLLATLPCWDNNNNRSSKKLPLHTKSENAALCA
ncbi:hypothetical protein NDU88_010893 [Pleurodeles waltl]|uniref:Monocarboxylate transporter 9 n=2 Tax=Pleurodeles waltl TaxID=8319 RepID=A0AAV7QZG7_PLEWA|nr:hypothetical protein NDU88_010893 [Pleurodeles waltl]